MFDENHWLKLKNYLLLNQRHLVSFFLVVVGGLCVVAGIILIVSPLTRPLPLVWQSADTGQPATLFVDIGGAVEKPGLYQVEAGKRVGDVLTEAGGLSVEADLEYVHHQLNSAQLVTDQQKIYIPFTGEGSSSNDSSHGTTDVSSSSISINTASVTELEALPGIGAKRAADIVAARPFTTIEELESKGVLSEKQFSQVKELVKL